MLLNSVDQFFYQTKKAGCCPAFLYVPYLPCMFKEISSAYYPWINFFLLLHDSKGIVLLGWIINPSKLGMVSNIHNSAKSSF
ncbi:MAG: hypothetical protein CMI24_06340 [Opitutae bacterium]|nr:hypothetical protein [Opitutae bacterium]